MLSAIVVKPSLNWLVIKADISSHDFGLLFLISDYITLPLFLMITIKRIFLSNFSVILYFIFLLLIRFCAIYRRLINILKFLVCLMFDVNHTKLCSIRPGTAIVASGKATTKFFFFYLKK